MPTTTLNVRISPELKMRGDAVLKEHGLSPSMVIRKLWQYLATNKEVPPFILEHTESKAERLLLAQKLSSVPQTRFSHMTDSEIEQFLADERMKDFA